MRKSRSVALRHSFSLSKTVLKTAALLATLTMPTLVAAQVFQPDGSVIVGNDRGGLILQRIDEIRNITQRGSPVKIQGSICYSTCTMYLGLAQTCVSRDTTFGFHGPSYGGIPMSRPLFDNASQIIASHYPEVLREWYMTEGRSSIYDLYKISGSEMIRLGVREC